MKKRNLVILIAILIIIILVVCCFIFNQMSKSHGTATVAVDTNVIYDHIDKNESKDGNLKNFIALKEISLITKKENVEYYVLALINKYDMENKSIEYNKSDLKIYKFILEDTKIISSNNLNIEDISDYNDYNVFPKEIITKCLPLKDSVDLTNAIEKQIENYYNKDNNDSNSINELSEDYRFVSEPTQLPSYSINP